MKYQVTCDNCGTQFIIEGKGGQTVGCHCPHCGGEMEITLPIVGPGMSNPGDGSQVGDDTWQPEPDGFDKPKSHRGVIIAVVAVIVVAVVAAVAIISRRNATPPEDTQVFQVDTLPETDNGEMPEELDTVVAPPEDEPKIELDTTSAAPLEPHQQAEDENAEDVEGEENADEDNAALDESTAKPSEKSSEKQSASESSSSNSKKSHSKDNKESKHSNE